MYIHPFDCKYASAPAKLLPFTPFLSPVCVEPAKRITQVFVEILSDLNDVSEFKTISKTAALAKYHVSMRELDQIPSGVKGKARFFLLEVHLPISFH